MGCHEDTSSQSSTWPNIPPSNRTDLQSRITKSKQLPGSILYNGATSTPNTSQLSNIYIILFQCFHLWALLHLLKWLQQHPAELQAQENQMMTQFQEVMSLLKQANSTQNTATSDNKINEHKPNKSKCNTNKSSPPPCKYCWTHGAFAHTSPECNCKSDKHLDEVTFVNMLGGLSAGFYWLQAWQFGTSDSCIYNVNKTVTHSSDVVPPTISSFAILDSGATGNFVRKIDKHKSYHPVSKWYKYESNSRRSTSTLKSPFTIAQVSIVLDDLKTGMLISLFQLCDDYCMVLFTKHDVKLPNRTKLSSWADFSRAAYGRHQKCQCLCNRQMTFSDLTREKRNWLTITMHRLVAPPNQHSSEQFVRDIS